jgi:hypothetical protein
VVISLRNSNEDREQDPKSVLKEGNTGQNSAPRQKKDIGKGGDDRHNILIRHELGGQLFSLSNKGHMAKHAVLNVATPNSIHQEP